ncbi:hypothetical protein NW761_005644 [Fusarium oxysporum]|nr:hypothetical protein NW758_013637 [Fusarium oxysporum]KAJ4036298.1 hypothetical protein NW753_012014 [Fusarium oxysporum]KAJ4067860.1 hypothetical protein NW763_001403 [Fusarium oxysporum]KAJ4086594.1 hypothetical protein NW756_008420 [Fusarium oxysporum]KAJ4092752.1 hypothetical protein NW769_012373 [Fusarium oxysporum]
MDTVTVGSSPAWQPNLTRGCAASVAHSEALAFHYRFQLVFTRQDPCVNGTFCLQSSSNCRDEFRVYHEQLKIGNLIIVGRRSCEVVNRFPFSVSLHGLSALKFRRFLTSITFLTYRTARNG